MPVVRRSEAQTFSIDHTATSFLSLAAPSRGSKETSLWEVTVPPHEEGVTHSLDHEEIFVLLAGRAVTEVDGTAHELAAGDCLVLPAHESFSLSNPFDEPMTAIVVFPVGGRARIGDGEPFTPPWAA